MTYLLSISTCEVPVTDPCSGTIGPNLCREKQPQCMRLGLCLTVTETQGSENSSAGSLHTLQVRLC